MNKADARVLLRDWSGDDGLEDWTAEQPWQAVPSGWALVGERQGWRFRIDVIPAGLRITASAPGGAPAVGSSQNKRPARPG
jgi:hypothetical protein